LRGLDVALVEVQRRVELRLARQQFLERRLKGRWVWTG